MIFRTLGYIMLAEGLMLLLPVIVALIYRENTALIFLLTALTCGAVGSALAWIFGRGASSTIHSREGFIIVALAWISVSVFGALPFVLTGSIPNFIDAFFETASGFTTTGASILSNVEALSKSVLFWRSFTHWVGGMGVLVFVLTVIPMTGSGAVYLIRAEMPGPTPGKLVPKLKDTAKILYIIYLLMTAMLAILLCAGGMPLFESLVHAFGTAGTGGFSSWNTSVAHYESSYIHWVISIFMLLFGVNFNLYYFLLLRQFKEVFSNSELRMYITVIVIAILTIALNIRGMYSNFAIALRDSAFQVTSIISSTGYATADFDTWPQISRTILLMLMFMGACAGSTGGGFKVIRILLMKRVVSRGIKRILHPRAVSAIKMDGKTVPDNVIESLASYLMICCFILVAVILVLSIDGFSFGTNFSAAVSCFNNIGPGIEAVGPTCNYSGYSWFSKLVLTFTMLAGRLEVFPMVILFTTLQPKTNGGKLNGKKHSTRSFEKI